MQQNKPQTVRVFANGQQLTTVQMPPVQHLLKQAACSADR